MATEDDGSVKKMTEKREKMVQRRNPLQGALLRLWIEGDAMVGSNSKRVIGDRWKRHEEWLGNFRVRKLARSFFTSSTHHRPQTAH